MKAITLVNLGTKRELILKILRENGPMIDEKIVDYFQQTMNYSPQAIRTLRKQLVRMWLVKEEGSLEKSASGKLCIVWKVVNNE